MEENEKIKEAVTELKGMSEDEELRILAELREKGRRDEYAARQYAIKQGLQEGREKGIKEGIKEGRKEKVIEIVKNMLKKKMKVEEICEITGLSINEIEKLK